MSNEREDMILLAIASLRGDVNRQIDAQNEHSVRVEAELFRQIHEVDTNVSQVQLSGCAKAGQHEGIEKRVKVLELKDATAKGELRGIVITVSFIGTAIGAAITWFIELLVRK